MKGLVACVAVWFLISACTGIVPMPTPTAASSAQSDSAVGGCRARQITPVTGPVFVAIADRGALPPVAFVVDAASGSVRGQIQIEPNLPEAALDPRGSQLVLLCGHGKSFELVAYDLRSLTERWRVSLPDALRTKAPGGGPSLAFSADGAQIFAMHAKALQPDAAASGGSRYWMSAHSATNGALLGEIELPECGAGRVLGGSTPAYVICKDGVRVVDLTASAATNIRSIPIPSLGPVALVDGPRLIGITRNARYFTLDLRTGIGTEHAWSEGASLSVGQLGSLSIGPDANRAWVLTKATGGSEWAPDTLTELDLAARKRVDTTRQGIRGVGFAGGRVVYFVDGRLRSLDGAFDVTLVGGRVNYWTVLSAPG